jgi:hypothetical protein
LIKIGFGKALGFSLLAFIGLNFLFIIIAQTVGGDLNTLFSAISSEPLITIVVLFDPLMIISGVFLPHMPGSVINLMYAQISLGSFDALLIQSIGSIVSPFVAALVAGRTGDGKGGSFGGWMLTALISSAALSVYAFIQFLDPIMLIISLILTGVVNGIFYGCFALLFSKSEMY